MLDILGKKYYINVDEIIKICRSDYGTDGFDEKKKPSSTEPLLELNIFKFEVFKACVERILNEYEEVDEKLGAFAAEESTSISFKVAYNTLLKYNILIEDDNNY
jgi:hypothetical protein